MPPLLLLFSVFPGGGRSLKLMGVAPPGPPVLAHSSSGRQTLATHIVSPMLLEVEASADDLDGGASSSYIPESPRLQKPGTAGSGGNGHWAVATNRVPADKPPSSQGGRTPAQRRASGSVAAYPLDQRLSPRSKARAAEAATGSPPGAAALDAVSSAANLTPSEALALMQSTRSRRSSSRDIVPGVGQHSTFTATPSTTWPDEPPGISGQQQQQLPVKPGSRASPMRTRPMQPLNLVVEPLGGSGSSPVAGAGPSFSAYGPPGDPGGAASSSGPPQPLGRRSTSNSIPASSDGQAAPGSAAGGPRSSTGWLPGSGSLSSYPRVSSPQRLPGGGSGAAAAAAAAAEPPLSSLLQVRGSLEMSSVDVGGGRGGDATATTSFGGQLLGASAAAHRSNGRYKNDDDADLESSESTYVQPPLGRRQLSGRGGAPPPGGGQAAGADDGRGMGVGPMPGSARTRTATGEVFAGLEVSGTGPAGASPARSRRPSVGPAASPAPGKTRAPSANAVGADSPAVAGSVSRAPRPTATAVARPAPGSAGAKGAAAAGAGSAAGARRVSSGAVSSPKATATTPTKGTAAARRPSGSEAAAAGAGGSPTQLPPRPVVPEPSSTSMRSRGAVARHVRNHSDETAFSDVAESVNLNLNGFGVDDEDLRSSALMKDLRHFNASEEDALWRQHHPGGGHHHGVHGGLAPVADSGGDTTQDLFDVHDPPGRHRAEGSGSRRATAADAAGGGAAFASGSNKQSSGSSGSSAPPHYHVAAALGTKPGISVRGSVDADVDVLQGDVMSHGSHSGELPSSRTRTPNLDAAPAAAAANARKSSVGGAMPSRQQPVAAPAVPVTLTSPLPPIQPTAASFGNARRSVGHLHETHALRDSSAHSVDILLGHHAAMHERPAAAASAQGHAGVGVPGGPASYLSLHAARERLFTPPVVPPSQLAEGQRGRRGSATGGDSPPQVLRVFESGADGSAPEVMVDVVYDPVLGCYYDAKTNMYYDLK